MRYGQDQFKVRLWLPDALKKAKYHRNAIWQLAFYELNRFLDWTKERPRIGEIMTRL